MLLKGTRDVINFVMPGGEGKEKTDNWGSILQDQNPWGGGVVGGGGGLASQATRETTTKMGSC